MLDPSNAGPLKPLPEGLHAASPTVVEYILHRRARDSVSPTPASSPFRNSQEFESGEAFTDQPARGPLAQLEAPSGAYSIPTLPTMITAPANGSDQSPELFISDLSPHRHGQWKPQTQTQSNSPAPTSR